MILTDVSLNKRFNWIWVKFKEVFWYKPGKLPMANQGTSEINKKSQKVLMTINLKLSLVMTSC